MSHVQSVLSKSEVAHADEVEAGGTRMGPATRRLLGVALAASLCAGTVNVAQAGDTERKVNIATLFGAVTQIARGGQDGKIDLGDILQAGGTALIVRGVTDTSKEGGAGALGAWDKVNEGVGTIFGGFGSSTPSAGVPAPTHRAETPLPGGSPTAGSAGESIPQHVGWSQIDRGDATRIDLYNLDTGRKFASSLYENTPEGQAQMKASLIALDKKSQLERI